MSSRQQSAEMRIRWRKAWACAALLVCWSPGGGEAQPIGGNPEVAEGESPKDAPGGAPSARRTPHCGHPDARARPDGWESWTCRAGSSDACLGANAYVGRGGVGCPGAELCCPPVSGDAAVSRTAVRAPEEPQFRPDAMGEPDPIPAAKRVRPYLVGAVAFFVLWGIWMWRRARRRAEEARAYGMRLGVALEALANAVRSGSGMPAEQIGDAYLPKRGERVFAVVQGVCRAVPRTRSVAYRHEGFRFSLPIAGGLRYVAGETKVSTVEETSLVTEASGTFVVTTSRLLFNADGLGTNWSVTWAGVAGMRVLRNGIEIDPTSGKPCFVLFGTPESPNGTPSRDPRYVLAAMHLAFENSQRDPGDGRPTYTMEH